MTLSKELNESLRVVIARLPFVTRAVGGGVTDMLFRATAKTIPVNTLSAVLMDLAKEGSEDIFVEDEALIERGKTLIEKPKSKAGPL